MLEERCRVVVVAAAVVVVVVVVVVFPIVGTGLFTATKRAISYRTNIPDKNFLNQNFLLLKRLFHASPCVNFGIFSKKLIPQKRHWNRSRMPQRVAIEMPK